MEPVSATENSGRNTEAERGAFRLTSEAEVQNFDPAFGRDLDVGGLQIAVHDAFLVGGFEGSSNLIGAVERDCYGQGAAKGFAFDEFQDETFDATGFFEAVNRADVGMIQRCQRASFAAEAGEAGRVAGEFSGQRFNCDVAPEFAIVGAVDFAHAADAEGRQNLVRSQLTPGLHRHRYSRILYRWLFKKAYGPEVVRKEQFYLLPQAWIVAASLIEERTASLRRVL